MAGRASFRPEERLQHGQCNPSNLPSASRAMLVLTSPSGSRTCKAVSREWATRHHLDGG